MKFFDQAFETETQIEIREITKKFARAQILPIVEHDEETKKFRPEIIKGLGALGLTGIPTSEKNGGAGLGYQEYVGAIEEIASEWCIRGERCGVWTSASDFRKTWHRTSAANVYSETCIGRMDWIFCAVGSVFWL
jgi:alkylation response protein AidB-like acyl-CoA dehydrogenase